MPFNCWAAYYGRPAWKRLIDDQVIRPTKYGHVTFTLPLFGDFIRENQVLLDLMWPDFGAILH